MDRDFLTENYLENGWKQTTEDSDLCMIFLLGNPAYIFHANFCIWPYILFVILIFVIFIFIGIWVLALVEAYNMIKKPKDKIWSCQVTPQNEFINSKL